MEFATLSNGVRMPKVGFGVYRVPAEECQPVVQKALEVGYRHLDTAQCYFNEEQVGAAIQASPVDRSDIFLTTKVWIGCYGEGQTYASVERSLRRLKTDYLDLVLLHQAFADYYGAWRDLVRLYEEGKVRAIGTSNFLPVRHNGRPAFGGAAGEPGGDKPALPAARRPRLLWRPPASSTRPGPRWAQARPASWTARHLRHRRAPWQDDSAGGAALAPATRHRGARGVHARCARTSTSLTSSSRPRTWPPSRPWTRAMAPSSTRPTPRQSTSSARWWRSAATLL